MKINGITDIARFLTDEAAAQDALANLRWPNGVACPLCEGGKKVYEVSYKHVAKDGKETVCQPARDVDPGSASKVDPLWMGSAGCPGSP